ncbi:hypothetical protein ACNKH9_19150 [Metapseudomonas otitidis]|uniref:hypothetical protein n=1 Tax=Metapseudomonas otitidis TaxID=319939 RepID=UPI003A89C3F5
MNETKTYEDVSKLIDEAQDVLRKLDVRVRESSVLHKIFQDARKVAKFWSTEPSRLTINMAISLLHADKICDAIVRLQNDPKIADHLRIVSGGNVNLSQRDRSPGKDILWELTLLNSIRRASIKASLIEPPDIVVDMEFGEYSIACKKIYSESNVIGRLRSGVDQIARSKNKGIVAFNLDDLTPGDSILAKGDMESSMRRVSRFNMEFISRHQSEFQEYVGKKKIDGILVSTSILADVITDGRRLSNVTQYDFWTLSGHKKSNIRIESFVDRLKNRPFFI